MAQENNEKHEQDNIVERIDSALERYYRSLKVPNYKNEDGQGRFELFCHDNGFEDNDINGELESGADECMLVDFDKQFPFSQPLNPKKRNKEIFRIIKHCAEYACPPPPRTKFNFDIPSSQLKQLEIQYKKQMPLLAKIGEKEPDLWYFLALGRHTTNNISFLTNMVDLYTRDKTELFCKPQQKQTRLTVEDWCTNYNNFMMELKRTNLTRAEKLKSAMISYSNRIMCRLQFTPTYKIMDDIQEISKYIISVPLFISKLITFEKSAVPFSVDLLIAVRNVKECTFVLDDYDDKNNDSDDDDDDSDYFQNNNSAEKVLPEQKNPRVDYIGSMEDIKQRLKAAKTRYFGPQDIDKIEFDKLDTRYTMLINMYKQFRNVLAAHKSGDNVGKNVMNDDGDNGGKKNNFGKKGNYKGNEHVPFHDQFYPQRKRFEIFVDRRDNGDDKSEDIECKLNDKILFFQPPNDCDTLPKNHVDEWFMEAARTCLIPSGNYMNERKDGFVGNDNERGTITATDNLCGQLLTFSYHVNTENQIKCYIIWNSQTMRFHGDYIKKVLPSIFEESVENNEFISGKNRLGSKIQDAQQQFDELMPDPDFENFCSQYN